MKKMAWKINDVEKRVFVNREQGVDEQQIVPAGEYFDCTINGFSGIVSYI